MALPTVTQTWTISPSNRYEFLTASTIVNVMSNVVLSWKNFMKTTMGYTVKGSCDGSTGAMDATDRWSTAANAGTRNNGAGGAQSWFVLTDGAGMDICLSYNSSADDIYRLAYSPGGNYVAAGTANQQPTATDEVFDTINGTWVNSTTSADRVWHMWGSSDKKMTRILICRQGALVSASGVEKVTSVLVAPATFTLANGNGTNAACKFYYNTFAYLLGSGIGGPYSSGTTAGVARVHTSADFTILLGGCQEFIWSGRSDTPPLTTSLERAELQGMQGLIIVPCGWSSQTTNAQGKMANRIDWWIPYNGSSSVPAIGDTFGNLQFLSLGPQSMWPWDGITQPVIY